MSENIKNSINNSADVVRNGYDAMRGMFKNVYDVECVGVDGNVKWTDKIENIVVNAGLDDVLNQYFKGSAYTATHYSGLFNEVGTSTITNITQATNAVISTPSTTGISNGDRIRINNVVGMTEINGLEGVVQSFVANTSITVDIDSTGFTAYSSGGNWWEDPVVAADTMASHAGWTENQNYSEANRPTITLGTVASQSVDNSASKAVFTINASGTIGGVFVTTDNTKGGTTGTLYGGGVFTGGSKAVANSDTLNVTHTFTMATA